MREMQCGAPRHRVGHGGWTSVVGRVHGFAAGRQEDGDRDAEREGQP